MKTFREFTEEPKKMNTLYVHRPVLSGKKILKWFEDNFNCSHLKEDDLHVTIAFSRKKVDWVKLTPEDEELMIEVDAKPERLGDKGAIVLKFKSEELLKRWKEFKDAGASWDYDGYSPHITLTYEYTGSDKDLKKVPAFKGRITLGAEKFAEVVEDWDQTIDEE